MLWIDEENIIAYLIDVADQKAFPFVKKIQELNDDVIQDNLMKIKGDTIFFRSDANDRDQKNAVWRLRE